MNEKINSLRLDAGISTLENDPRLVVINKNGEIIDPMIGLEKFAELIVKESARFVSILDAEPMSHRSASILLLEHFGLES